MPIVRIDIQRGFSVEYRKCILDSVHSALVTSFLIPEDDRTQFLREHESSDFERPSTKSSKYTVVEISAFQGRSREAKRSLYRSIVENLAASPGISPTDLLILLNEQPLQNWGVMGGKVADEVDLGFEVKV